MSAALDRPVTIRLSIEDDVLIKEAATCKHLQKTVYMRQSLRKQAELDLITQKEYIFSDEEMYNFWAALDTPAQPKPELEKLFSKKTILDD